MSSPGHSTNPESNSCLLIGITAGDPDPASNAYSKTSISVDFLLPASSQQQPALAAPATFVHKHGQIKAAVGAYSVSGMYTLAAAEAACAKEPRCNAITFDASKSGGAAFKRKNVAGSKETFNPI